MCCPKKYATRTRRASNKPHHDTPPHPNTSSSHEKYRKLVGKKSQAKLSGVTAKRGELGNWELAGCSCSWPGQLACSKPGCEQISCIFQKSCGICNVVIVGVAVAGALRFYFGQRVKIREVTLVQIILQDKPAHLTCYQCKRCRRAQSANPADAEDTEYAE